MAKEKMQKTILIVEDDRNMVEAYKELLSCDYNLITAYTGRDAFVKFKKLEIDLAILDIILPDIDGTEVLRRIRKINKDIPVIVVSGLNEARPAVESMKLGACEYVTKPFAIDDLKTKIKETLRKDEYYSPIPDETISYDSMTVNLSQRSVMIKGRLIDLTYKEYELLLLFLRNKGRVLKREMILEEIWGIYRESGEKTLDTHIYVLRKKLNSMGENIVTVVREGYKFDTEEGSAM